MSIKRGSCAYLLTLQVSAPPLVAIFLPVQSFIFPVYLLWWVVYWITVCNPHIVLTLRPSVLPCQGYFALSLFPVVHLGRYSMCGLKLYTCLKTGKAAFIRERFTWEHSCSTVGTNRYWCWNVLCKISALCSKRHKLNENTVACKTPLCTYFVLIVQKVHVNQFKLFKQFRTHPGMPEKRQKQKPQSLN